MNMRRNRESDLERQYYTQVYKKQPNTQPNREEFLSFLPKNPNSNYLQVNNSSSALSDDEYTDESEIKLIESHFKQLGVESIEFSALRNYSYLQSKENDCIESLLLKIQEPQVAEKVEESQVVEIVELKCSEKVQNNLRKIVSYFSFENLSKIFKPIDFQSNNYLLWLAMVSFFYVYNIFSITIRYSFEYDKIDESKNESESFNITENFVFNNISHLFVSNISNNHTSNNSVNFSDKTVARISIIDYLKYILMTYFIEGKLYWFLFDYTSDLIYLIDIFLIQTRIKFIKEGLWVNDLKSTALNYFQGSKFKVSNKKTFSPIPECAVFGTRYRKCFLIFFPRLCLVLFATIEFYKKVKNWSVEVSSF
jgi:hypothetical protein